jgi:hypothetical protein
MFEKKTVLELKAICKVLDIDVKDLKKKVDYLGAIETSGYTWESYLEKVDKDFTYVEAEVKEETEVKVEVKEKVETLAQEDVVLKMVHPRSALNVSNIITFTIEQPFQVMSASKAEEILNLARGEVRRATTDEVKSFYGIE